MQLNKNKNKFFFLDVILSFLFSIILFSSIFYNLQRGRISFSGFSGWEIIGYLLLVLLFTLFPIISKFLKDKEYKILYEIIKFIRFLTGIIILGIFSIGLLCFLSPGCGP